jgi:hypothetical protein
MTPKEIILEKYPKAQCCAELDSDNAESKNKKYIICRKIKENEIEKMSIGEKYYNTPIDAWDNAVIYLQNKNLIEKLHDDNTDLKLENVLLRNENSELAYFNKKTHKVFSMALCFGIGLLSYIVIRKTVRTFF